ncbi:MAG: SpoIVB peptidase [Clostridia bacterium]|nr:SpoIVB peptidase [Clostridia bacterium]
MNCKNKRNLKLFSVGLMTLVLVMATVLGIYNFMIPDEISLFSGEAIPSYLGADAIFVGEQACISEQEDALFYEREAEYKLLGVIPLKTVNLVSYKDIKLYPGGMPFGVRFFTKGVMVIGFCDLDTENGKVNPAYDAGLRQKDIITHIGGKEISSALELTEAVENSGGKPLILRYQRDGTSLEATVTPMYSEAEGIYKTGIWVKDSGAGIGTVSFIVPESNYFTGLGHGICDADTGKLLPIERGTVVDVTISGINKGVSGTPGEIKGFFNAGKTGTLLGNDECGVYGIFSECPKTACEPLPLALRNEIAEGEAFIYCTLDTGKIGKYSVEIQNINRNATGGKCFIVKVTDKALLEKTGGIVQGMSGSPIIQNGKLVGAVTHVMIGDPTTGYGIFAENMLKLISKE